jgi:uncharacterized protein YxjI
VLESNSFVIKERARILTARKAYDVLDGETAKPLGTAATVVGGAWTALGLVLGKNSVPVTIEVREPPDDSLLFTVRRSGLVLKRVEAHDSQGVLLGSYRAKRLSLAGGFQVYDKDGAPFADVRGKLFRSEYTFVTPDGKAELAKVTKQWGGLAKELFTSADTYGVRIDPDFAEQPIAKMLILGAALAIGALFPKGKDD